MTVRFGLETAEQAQKVSLALEPFAREMERRHDVAHCEVTGVFGVFIFDLYNWDGSHVRQVMGVAAMAMILTSREKITAAIDLLVRRTRRASLTAVARDAGLYLA